MKFLSLDLIKAHVRIDANCEDALLEFYGEAAENTVTNYLNRGKTTDEMLASMTEEYGSLPFDVIQAGLMLVDISYQFRSAVTPTNLSMVPYGNFDAKLKPYAKL